MGIDPKAGRAGVILVVGDANADLAAALDRFPREGDDHAMRGLTWGSGGSGANVASGIARLGGRARLVARVGADPAAEVALRAARAAGVDLEAVQRDAEISTGLCFAAVSPGGERTFFSHRGANAALAPPDPGAAFREVAWLHVAGHALIEGRQREATLGLVAEARRRGAPVSLDVCLPLLRAWPDIFGVLGPSLAVVFANEREMRAIAAPGAPDGAADAPETPDGHAIEAALAALAASGVPLVAAKLGPRGSLVAGPGAARRALPACAVEARDTTGSGDAYVAAFLLALLRGAPPDLAGRAANAAGALTATRPGAADALPDRGALLSFLAARAAADHVDAARLFPPAEQDLR